MLTEFFRPAPPPLPLHWWFQLPSASGECVTLTKAAATAKSSINAVKLYPEILSCKHVNSGL